MKTVDPVLFQNRKQNILRRARHLFATRGLAESSMDEIARSCRIQKASLYHYFSSKQNILQELVDTECARWSQRVREFSKGLSLEETLRTIGRTFLNDMKEPDRREFFSLIYFESHKNPSILRALKESPTHHREGFLSVFAEHLEKGLSRTKVVMFMTQFMGALIHFAAQTRLRGQNLCLAPIQDADYVEQLVAVFMRSVPHL